MSSQSNDPNTSVIARSVVTIGIWGVLFIIIEKITAMEAGGNADLRMLPIVIGLVAVSVITLALWAGDIMGSFRGERGYEKAKNTGYDTAPAQLLLSLMTDEERHQIRSRLVNNVGDGELVGLEDLAYQEQQDY